MAAAAAAVVLGVGEDDSMSDISSVSVGEEEEEEVGLLDTASLGVGSEGGPTTLAALLDMDDGALGASLGGSGVVDAAQLL